MKKSILLGALLASAMTLSACNSGSPTANTSGNGSSTATNTATPTGGNSTAGNTSGNTVTADATNQNFTIRNNTGHVITHLYVAPTSSDNWEEDILGQDTLANGQTLDIQFERAETECQWDIKVDFDDGTSLEERNVNLCQTGTIDIAP